MDRDCGNCVDENSLSIRTQGLPLVMAYVPDQGWEETNEPERALNAGTLFPELDLPFYPTACNRRNGCGCN